MNETKLTLAQARDQVTADTGRCLLTLQAYERLLKGIVAHHRLEAPFGKMEQARTDRMSQTARATLGTLIGEMLGSVVIPEGAPAAEQEDDEAGTFRFRMYIALSPEDYARTAEQVRELVKRRNDLVHHFLDQHDLRTLEGCMSALDSLAATEKLTLQAYGDLQVLAKQLDTARVAMAERFSDPAMTEWIVKGRGPWHVTMIAQALQEAADALATEGWTSVDAAVAWIGACYPDEQPEGYGCRTWRQIIHESGLFDLKSKGRKTAWYRPRSALTEGSASAPDR